MTKHIRADALVAYALEAMGGGYVYGSSGQVCSLKVRESCAEANPSQRENILGICAKWDGKKVWDCSGLFRGAWRALWQYRSGGATTIYRTWCETKDRINAQDIFTAACSVSGLVGTTPDLPGTLLFRGEGTTMQHIGLYVGGGMVVDARGSRQGVLHTRFQEGYTWTHWGLADDVDYDNAIQGPADIPALWVGHVKTRTGSGVSLWRDNTKKAALCKIPDGQRVEILGENDGKGFAGARHGGLTGVVDLQYVVPEDGEEPAQETYRARVVGVNIGLNLRTAPKNAVNTILLLPPGGVVEVFPENASGAYAYVRYLGQAGYATAAKLDRLADGVA